MFQLIEKCKSSLIRLTASVLCLGALTFAASAARAYEVWLCDGYGWAIRITTPRYNDAVNYKNQFIRMGYKSEVTATRSQRPTGSCQPTNPRCLYWAKMAYRGQFVGYLGGYDSQAKAEAAARNWVRGVGAGASFLGVYKQCQ